MLLRSTEPVRAPGSAILRSFWCFEIVAWYALTIDSLQAKDLALALTLVMAP